MTLANSLETKGTEKMLSDSSQFCSPSTSVVG
jgi:hypothetical protein